MVRPRFINLNPVEFPYYPFISSLDRCDESCNTDEDAFGRICALNEIEDLNVKVVNMMKRRNEQKTFIKLVSCEFNGRKFD